MQPPPEAPIEKTSKNDCGGDARQAPRLFGQFQEWIFRVLAGLGAVLICALCGELYARVVADDGMQFDLEMWKYAVELKQISSDPLIGHEHRPNRAAHLMGVSVETNSRKLREREIPYQRQPGTLRILMLGDSFTEGWGVPLQDTFSKRIERLFQEDRIAAEVINAGVGNYNSIQEARYFLTEGYKYDPDIVVVNFSFNDAEPVPIYSSPGLLGRNCYFCVVLVGHIDTLLRVVGSRPVWSDYYLGLFDGGAAPGWRDARLALHGLAVFCKERNIKLLIANFPEMRQLRPYRLGAITNLIRQTAEQEGAGFVDLLPAVVDEEPSRLVVTPEDPHPNSYANGLFAKALFAELLKLAGECCR